MGSWRVAGGLCVLAELAVCCRLFAPGSAVASGFQLNESSARLAGTAYAGTAELAEDPSMGWFNPAGITRLQGGSAVGTLSLIHLDVELTASQATTFGTIPVTGPDGSLDASGGTDKVVPSFHVAQRIDDDWVGGLSVTSPFGSAIDYPDDSVTRYMGTLSQLVTININPYVAYEPIDHLSFGVGFNAQHLRRT